MSKPFTEKELTLMKGKYASLARKYNTTTAYVKMIANGKREHNSKLARMVFKDIGNIIKLFTPIDKTNLNKSKIVRS